MGLGGSPSPPLSGLSTLAGTSVHVLRECRSTWPRWTDSWDTCEPQCFDRRTNCRSGGHNNLNSHSGPLRAASVPWHLPPLPSFLHPLLLPLLRSELPWHSWTLLIPPEMPREDPLPRRGAKHSSGKHPLSQCVTAHVFQELAVPAGCGSGGTGRRLFFFIYVVAPGLSYGRQAP